MIRSCFVCLLSLALLTPQLGLAELTSENFVVTDPVVGAGEVSVIGASENFSVNERLVTDVTATTTPPTAPDARGGGTRVIRSTVEAETGVLTEADGVKVCLSGDGPSTVYNVRVLLGLITGNSFSDSGAIIPAFLYDFGAGVQAFGGQNWTPENQVIFNTDCLRTTTTVPDIPPPPRPPVREVPPPISEIETPVRICDGVSQAQKIITALDANTLLLISSPQGSLVQESTGNGELWMRVGVIEYPEDRQAFITLLNRYIASETDNERATIFVPTPLRSTVLSTTPLPNNVSSNPCQPTATSTDYSLASSTILNRVATPLTGARLGTLDPAALRGLQIGLLIPSFRIAVGDRMGRSLEQFASPLLVEVFNPMIATEAAGLYLVTTVDGGRTWQEVPFLIDGNFLRFETNTPGEFYLWSSFTPVTPAVTEAQTRGAYAFITWQLVSGISIALLLLILYVFRQRGVRQR